MVIKKLPKKREIKAKKEVLGVINEIKSMRVEKPTLNKSKGQVKTYTPNWAEYFDYLFSEEPYKQYAISKFISKLNLPNVVAWYIYGLEKAGFDITKFDMDFKLPKQAMLELHRTTNRYMSLSKLYYKYWFPLKAYNFKDRDFRKKFSPLSWIASGIYAYIENDFDYLLMANGLEGTGKSSIALNLALRLKTLGLGFNPLTHIFFKTTPEDYIINMIENTNRQVFIFDEARAHFWKRSAMRKEQKDRIMALTMQRARNHVYILCTRQPDDVDVDLRNSRVASVLYSVDKGEIAFLLNRNVGFAGKDPFGFNKIAEAYKYKKIKTPLQLKRIILNLPSLHAFFKVEPLPENIYNLYKELKLELNKVGKVSLQKINKDRLLSVVLSDEKIVEKIAEKLDLSKELISLMVVGDNL